MTFASEMDPSIFLEEKTGCVTIFSLNKGHAELLVEGVKDGRKYVIKTHFTGTASSTISKRAISHTGIGRVKTKEIKPPIKYAIKSETWITTAENIEFLIGDAKNQGKYDQNFSIFGNDSIFELRNSPIVHGIKMLFNRDYEEEPYHNCMSWAKYMVEHHLNLRFEPKVVNLLITATPLDIKLKQLKKKDIILEDYNGMDPSFSDISDIC
jgi:hypothetical protein